MKRGFSLIMAVFFVVLIATLGMMALSFSTSTIKQSSNIYLREQAEVLARSAAEIAIMAMQDHNYSTNCLKNVKVFYPSGGVNAILEAKVSMWYFDRNLTGCSNRILSAIYTLEDRHNIVDNIAMLDISVKSINNSTTEPISLHKRIIQRP
ncbi:hypothetical protein CBLAS_0633 [Campylobacter blaseri]|uniref:Type II secretion system protein n=1 Tax=Campylobacter blaseri TaxID=2042961 RepID=A0A2P8R204_9BACT|nr:hypothetical protein [Campylobacter blaseri]PSM52527.1 hypothetical protein CQ405_02025 [Campylobacter blaseri]PSM54175.1 hypothetical protein CRN67_02025 [Campylobacter blaseri]QKF85825.1 hypothetical protein CBLAS_0633 [Campylobacter blaseri]